MLRASGRTRHVTGLTLISTGLRRLAFRHAIRAGGAMLHLFYLMPKRDPRDFDSQRISSPRLFDIRWRLLFAMRREFRARSSPGDEMPML